MKAKDVFTPGRFPTHTFVDTHLKEKEVQLADALDSGSVLVSISGPSKSGKTVFVENLLQKERLIQVTGAGVGSPEDLWLRVFDFIGTPIKRVLTSEKEIGGAVSLSGGADWNFILVKPKGEIKGEGKYASREAETVETAVDPLQLLIKEIAGVSCQLK